MKAAELPPDLQTQYEALLHTVWDTERRERMMDRIDAALDAEERRRPQDNGGLSAATTKDQPLSRGRQ